jgi:hypothetical protein
MANPNIKVNTGNTAQVVVYGVVGLAVLAVAYFGILKPILNNLGITKDKTDRKADDVIDDVTRTQILSDLMYKSNKSKATITSAKAHTSAYQIYNAKWGGWGGLSDKEDQAVGAITSAGSLVNVSYIAYVFQNTYGVSLESYLESFLESNNWITIDAYLKKTKNF